MSAIAFWLALALVAYAYVGYPLLVVALARWRGCTSRVDDIAPPLTVVIAAYNEASRIGARVRDVLAQDYPVDRIRVVVVSDGSDDGTERAADIGDARVRVIALPLNGGKAVALNAALATVDTEIVAFTDARQRYAPGALRALVAAFADDRVGAVTGELVIVENAADGPRPERIGLYWKMEKALRAGEAKLGWLHGVSGAVYALRRNLFRPLPPGTILDDMAVPFEVIFAGRRIVTARDAIAWDDASVSASEEFRRKLRTLSGNWQLLARWPRIANPLANPVFFAWFSHKFLRLLVPWALLVVLLASARAPGAFYRFALVAQLLAYAAAAFALLAPKPAARVPLAATAGTFVMLNAAALLSLPAAFALDPRGLWKKH